MYDFLKKNTQYLSSIGVDQWILSYEDYTGTVRFFGDIPKVDKKELCWNRFIS